MRSILPDWEVELARWLKPFLEQLGHKARRRMCPLYVAGLIGPVLDQAGQSHRVRLLLTAHGLPLKIVRAGDPYPDQIEETAAAVVAAAWVICRSTAGSQNSLPSLVAGPLPGAK